MNQVPGRLGLLVTLYLIATNVYNSVKAPPKRGFSYIEIWMIGVQIPMLAALIEYGFLLALKKYYPAQNVASDPESGKTVVVKTSSWATYLGPTITTS